MSGSFLHVDAERTVVFGADALAAAEGLIGAGFTLLSTARGMAAAPMLPARAGAIVHVPEGLVEDVAGGLRATVRGERLVALGGGRVLDVAKALAAADPPRVVLAVPTTLSGAEMTGVHRQLAGVPRDAPRARPRVVVNDPALSASAPVARLAATSANALGHAVTALTNDGAGPIAAAVGHEAIQRIAQAWGDGAGEPDRAELALGALLAGWAVDHSGLGLHHALAQTAVRTAGVGHAQANAALLPQTVAALRERRPELLGRLDERLGRPLERVAERLRERAGGEGLSVLRRDERLLAQAVEAATARPELARVGPMPRPAELRALYRAASR